MNTRSGKSVRLLIGFTLALFILAGLNTTMAAERELAFGVSGIVVSTMVKTGDSVEVGTVLAVLDQTVYAARANSAKATAVATKLVFDQAEVKAVQTRELYDSLSSSREDVDKAEHDLASARAVYEAKKARAEIAKWRLERATLRAPFSGTVVSVPGYPGMVVNPKAGNSAIVIIKTK